MQDDSHGIKTRDWQKEWTYLHAWKEAIALGELLFYLHTQIQGTERFSGEPRNIVAPHVILLGVLSVGSFFMVHVVIVFAIGFADSWR